jgi:hypothetical protein
LTNVSEVLTASIIREMMEDTILRGAISQKTVIFILAALRI